MLARGLGFTGRGVDEGDVIRLSSKRNCYQTREVKEAT